ncbi:MAG: hypothetical protein R3B09_25500 [Nannocystaceae bacterium]
MRALAPRSFRALALGAALAFAGSTALAACGPSSTERWVATENTNVDIDWDQVRKAYLDAEGPEDFERRVNEIYEGDEILSVSVRDVDDHTQVVTGFFDKDGSGTVEDGEKVFTIQRDITGEGSGTYQVQGYGHYAHYHSPVWDIAAGMMLGSFISRAFMPGYVPMYSTAYVTTPARRGAIASQRSTYRAQNPGRFARRSQSGRSYGSKGGSFGGGRSTPSSGGRRSYGGGRFGLAEARRGARTRVRVAA